MLGGVVEGAVGVARGGVRLDLDTLADMHRDLGVDILRLAREHDGTVHGVAEILFDRVIECVGHVLLERLADIDLLAGNGKLHIARNWVSRPPHPAIPGTGGLSEARHPSESSKPSQGYQKTSQFARAFVQRLRVT